MFRLISVASLALVVVNAKGGHHKHHEEGAPADHVEEAPHKAPETPAPAADKKPAADASDKKAVKKKDEVERGRSLL